MKLSKVIIVALLLSSACKEEILEVDPVTEYLSDNFYQTEEQVFSALVAAYDPVAWSMAYGQWISPVMFGEIRSDNSNAGGDPSDSDQPAWQELDDFRETNTNTVLQPIYERNYTGIFRANQVILKTELTSANVQRFQAEAKFLRAYYHFELFRHFGPSPIIDRTLTPDDINETRNTMTEMMEFITTDLKEAIEVLPSTLSESETGRASRATAQALLGKVYLYWADLDNDDAAKFDLAAQYLGEVVNSGQYQLVDDYNELFAYGVKNTVESVFEAQHSNLWSSDWGWFEGIEGNGIVQLCGIRGLCESHPDYSPGWGFMMPKAGLYDHFLSDDTYRRDAAVISVASLESDVAGMGCATAVDITQLNPNDFEGYFQGKYANYLAYNGNNVNGGDPNLTKDPNTHIIRYADVLLMLAESLHRGSGSDAEALTYIDMVRERAAGPGDNTGSFTTGQQVMTQQGWDLQDLIWYERRAELAGEGDRWYDLVRSGRATSSLFTDALRSGNFVDGQSTWIPVSLDETTVAPSITTYPESNLFQ